MKLFYRELGSGDTTLVILHGLFGSSDNWLSIARGLEEEYKLYLVDQRNHGQSFKTDEFNYKLLSEDLKQFIETHQINQPVIIGHSMGGKTAMNFAVHYPKLLKALVIVDIAPKDYKVHHDVILDGLKAIPITEISSRNEADKILAEYVPEVAVRQFLLKNLSRKSDGGFEWKINLKSINNNIEVIGQGMQYPGKYEGPTLFIRGKKSNYIKDEDRNLITEIFPDSNLVSFEDAGHWVHAEQPEKFLATIKEFLKNKVV
ncbi:MAG TPA: alpha/beta fold hydrolase [Cyclobacteriaceae bacterium]|nr:alpha/beta fold hydrolase [Cyclobacteriaceae bacterium]